MFILQLYKPSIHGRVTGLPVCPELTRNTLPKAADVGNFLCVSGWCPYILERVYKSEKINLDYYLIKRLIIQQLMYITISLVMLESAISNDYTFFLSVVLEDHGHHVDTNNPGSS